MATTTRDAPAPSLAGPVPFKDIGVGEGHAHAARPPEEYDDIVAALPCNPKLALRRYQGTWVQEPFARGLIAIQRGFAPRRGDVFLASPPKCGTTWLKALAFAAMARGEHPPAGEEHPLLRLNPHDCVPFMEGTFAEGSGSKVDALPSPRLMATHMHHSLLPASIAEGPDGKIVYVCREPKDMLVSMWHFMRSIAPHVTFSDVFEDACEGSCYGGPIWEHVLGYWNASKKNPEKVMFLRYEDMLHDPDNNVRKLARFLGQPFSSAEEEAGVVADVVKLCSFESLKNLEANKTGVTSTSRCISNSAIFRKGKIGDWVNHMTPEMAQRLDAVFCDKLQGSGLAFS